MYIHNIYMYIYVIYLIYMYAYVPNPKDSVTWTCQDDEPPPGWEVDQSNKASPGGVGSAG
jgi:hypothetical protein